MKQFVDMLHDVAERREHAVLCTLVDTGGSTPLKAGAKMLVWDDGRSFGTIGGGNVEKEVTAHAREILEKGVPELREYALLKQQMCCGGTVRVFFEPLLPQNRLVIFGAGHIGSHVAWFAQKLDFRVELVDERPDMLEQADAGPAEKISGHYVEVVNGMTFDPRTYIVICTHRHDYDRAILAACIGKPHAYLGMIGSRRKVVVTAKQFREKNIATTAQLQEVDMPMGYDLGSNTPAGIALGIVAGIVAAANAPAGIKGDGATADSLKAVS